MNDLCQMVRLAEMAVLDGETPPLSLDVARSHQAECADCRKAVAAMVTLHRELGRMPFERLDVDVWSGVRPQVVSAASTPRRSLTVGIAAAVLVAWRVAQLSFEFSAPLAMAVAGLAAIAVMGWLLASDPFAIRSSISELRQEGVR
jgi:hypothetical protein